jgi:hypothetical protein
VVVVVVVVVLCGVQGYMVCVGGSWVSGALDVKKAA